jgi:acid stress-induced BolA-like protein IbaG/YrbA
MELQHIKQLLEQHIPQAQVEIEGDGYHFQVTVVSDIFAGKTLVKKQQLVYAALNEQIVSGAIHAISIKTYTPDEWQQRS